MNLKCCAILNVKLNLMFFKMTLFYQDEKGNCGSVAVDGHAN